MRRLLSIVLIPFLALSCVRSNGGGRVPRPPPSSAPAPAPVVPEPAPESPVVDVPLCAEVSAGAPVVGVASAISPVREAKEPWIEALSREILGAGASPDIVLHAGGLVPDAATPYRADFDVAGLPSWSFSREQLLGSYFVARDERRYLDVVMPNFPRRALWLYPYNGCFVRAAHMAQSFERQGFPRPGKIFVLGDLRLRTPYDKRGTVYWSYHVAAAYRIDDQAVILDASIDPLRMLTLDEWITTIAENPASVKVAICDTYSYTPLNPCMGGGRVQESSIVNHLVSYLPDEWARVRDAGFDSARALGDQPPWLGEPPKVVSPPDCLPSE